jgi:hypothetical protein
MEECKTSESMPTSMYVCQPVCTALVYSILMYWLYCSCEIARGAKGGGEERRVECGVSHRSGEEEIGSNPGAAKGEVPTS